MTENTPDPIVALLDTARRARQNGDTAGARALLHAITARRPGDIRGWLLLATVAADRAEQRHALEQVVAIDPDNRAARRALDTLGRPPRADAPPPITHPVELAAPETEQAEQAEEPAYTGPVRWPLYAVLGFATAVILVTGFFILQQNQQQVLATATPLAVGAATPASVATTEAATALSGETGTAPTVQPILTSVVAPSAQPTDAPSVEPAASAVVEPTAVPIGPTPTPAVAFASFQQSDSWDVSLLRPSDAVVLSGSIGQLQPQGRFVLALVAVSNTATSERKLPAKLLTLVDAQGNRYEPQPAASAAYLQAYGSGQAGVVSMDNLIAAGGSLVSVPLIFDVPETTRGLQLTVGQASQGWSVGG